MVFVYYIDYSGHLEPFRVQIWTHGFGCNQRHHPLTANSADLDGPIADAHQVANISLMSNVYGF